MEINKSYLANWYENKAKKTALDYLGKKYVDDIKSKEELNLLYKMMIANLTNKLANNHIKLLGE